MRPLLLVSAVWLAACSAPLASPGSDAWLAQGDNEAELAPDATRARTARVRTAFVDGAFTPAALGTPTERTLPLFDDLSIEVVLDQIQVTHTRTTWVGHVHGWPEHEVVLSRTRDGLVSGIVRAPEATVRLRPTAPGEVLVEEINVRLGDIDAEPILPTFLPVADAMPSVAYDGAPVIDVLVAATAPVASDLGGKAGLEASATALVAQANKGYADSGVATRLRLAGVHVSTWDESGFAWSSTLGALATPGDGTLDDVPTAREAVGADVVSLLVDGDGGACGLGYLMAPARSSFAAAAYSLADAGCAASNLSFAHEIGHNLGLHHDRAHASGTGATDTAYGYQDPDASFRTVMAYDCAGTGCPRLNLWSNPEVKVEGSPAGVAASSELSAHNVLAMSLTAPVVAAFRDAPEEEGTPEAATIRTPEDGSSLSGATVAVAWEDVEADSYTLTVGSSAGAADLAKVDVEGTTYAVLPGLPTDGRTLYATLWSDHGGELVSSTATWTAAAPPPVAATITAPTSGSRLTDTTVRFTWEDAGADDYALVLGSSRFGSDLGSFTTRGTELRVSGLPDDGRTVWATLHTRTGEAWRSQTVTYGAYDAEPDADGPAELLEPADGATLSSRSLTLRWTDPGVERYAITLWSGETEVYHEVVTGTAASVSLPPSTDSGPLTLRLATQVGTQWFSREYGFTVK